MPSDRDDAPPKEAVEAITAWTLCSSAPVGSPSFTDDILRCARTLPGAARWHLAAWIVAGLEPTREMVEAALKDQRAWQEHPKPLKFQPVGMARHITAALAAAREAGDGE